MPTFICRLGFGLLLLLPASTLLAQTTTTVIPKCQDCTTKASKSMQSCMAARKGASCQADFQKHMKHCNKKWCVAKTKKVKVKTST
ncbi:MAG TPA: hypothetical protein VGL53_00235 [Bryobacteraceae bacterium]|jgi:hypothetical protein